MSPEYEGVEENITLWHIQRGNYPLAHSRESCWRWYDQTIKDLRARIPA